MFVFILLCNGVNGQRLEAVLQPQTFEVQRLWYPGGLPFKSDWGDRRTF